MLSTVHNTNKDACRGNSAHNVRTQKRNKLGRQAGATLGVNFKQNYVVGVGASLGF